MGPGQGLLERPCVYFGHLTGDVALLFGTYELC